MAAPAAAHPRNLAAPAAAATQRQRSVLARFLATIDPAHGERIASALLAEFRTISRILAQTPEALERILGQNHAITAILLGAREVILEGLQAEFTTEPVDPACPKLNQYLIASMGSLPDEVLRILFLDSAHRLIADEQMQHGSIRHLDVYPRSIFRRAMEHGATGIILVHNHPSGDPTPSENDVLSTRRLSALGRSLDIEIVDHIVVTASRANSVAAFNSMRATGSPTRAEVLSDHMGHGADEPSDGRPTALENARRTYRRRLLRRQLIGAPELFGEPAWDMLIDLFIHRCEGKKVATSALCTVTSSPPSTALRRINDLCDAQLVVKIADPDDGRRYFVELLPETAARLEAYFGAEEW